VSRYPSTMATNERDPAAEGAPLRALVERHRGRRVRLFGSVARGEEREGSDIDLLVDFVPGSSLFDLMHLHSELEALLRHPVDVVSRGGLRARDRGIVDEAVDL
jgi:predicted nucleotidyltransferase